MNRREFLKISSLSIPAIGTMRFYSGDSPDRDFWEDVKSKVESFTIHKFERGISSHPALSKIPEFAYSRELFEIQVAQAWGCLPSILAEMKYEDKVNIYAWYVANQQMEAVRLYEQRARQKRK